jgi:shikimate dehydrogenase
MITGRTALYGVLGHPVGHSLSPVMHEAAYREAGLDAVYVPLPVAPERLAEALRGAHALGFQGLNVTVPHKQRAAELCQRLDPVASLCGAVNTLRRLPGGWEGLNTDALACRDLIAAAPGPAAGEPRRALVLGAGGAALAGAWALSRLGYGLEVAARRGEAAEELCRRMRAAFPEGPGATALPWDRAAAASREAAVVVHATTIGLAGQQGVLPALELRRGQLAVDFVYGETAFAEQARARGATLVTGEQILVRQGALAFTIWTGKPAPEPAMAAALRGAPRAP